ncbi:hypothetical protein [Pseudoalteromonas umbrosa]|uniref:hypothetical protein n=1 Tax=Pseudoalteromonas umbrosa TaxID=3048489 RepID=UPI0024C25E9C|nr:hypothetical protein [Pseudoalteromonas sp. B95]MDK1290102.1 hypothetical protein [Pseudoalteromonas sp. B95]
MMLHANAKVKIKLATEDGEDCGYLKVTGHNNLDPFVSHVSEADATVLVLEQVKHADDAFYYRIADSTLYIDFSRTNDLLCAFRVELPVSLSSACAWKLTENNELEVIYLGRSPTNVFISPACNARQEERTAHDKNLVFCNYIGSGTVKPYKVQLIAQ